MSKEVDDLLVNPPKENSNIESPRDILLNQNHLKIEGVSVKPVKKKFKQSDSTDLTKILPQGKKKQLTLLLDFYGLSQPTFNSDGTKFVCGTENQFDEKNNLNRIVFGTFQQTKMGSKIWSYPIHEHIRSSDWIDDKRVILAMNMKLGILTLDDSGAASEILFIPPLHTDTIRQISYNTDNKLMISGGFDGNVYVTNILQLLDNMNRDDVKNENSVYVCKDVVGSVCWHPKNNYVASCTTDYGNLHMFDIRINENKPASIYDSKKSELYTHTYMNDDTVILGYGDGNIKIYDYRIGKTLLSFQDPYQKYIGDLSYQYGTCAVFGSETSFWKYTGSDIEISAHHTNSKAKGHKTSGCFIPQTNLVATTDSIGIFSIYETNKLGL